MLKLISIIRLMFEFFTSSYFLLFVRLCLGGVFLASALGKMADREGTAASMARYPFLPKGSGQFIAYTFPYLEIVVGFMLVFGLLTRVASVASVLMFILFTALVLYDLARWQGESCHCFGRISAEQLTPVAAVRNVALLLLSVLLAVSFDGWLSVDAALNGATAGKLALIAGPGGNGNLAESVPVILLSLLTVAIVVLGEQAVSTVRKTIQGTSIR
ncbi:MAG: DoxX family protein [Chloroflexota bacterium]|nr:DoxX family protein [Chloroflexota bacterium]